MSSDKSQLKNELGKVYAKPGALLATILLIIAGGLLAVMVLLPQGERINQSGYQVIYMTSGQAYFGKLQNTTGDYLTIKDPYTAQNVTPEGEKAPTNQQASTTLLKVSQQAYGPEDVLSVNRDQVLFWQNLRSDSKVAKAIDSKQ